MRRLAYIPARSGSKGIPKKNIRLLFGKPLLGWTIESAQKTGLFDKIMVSTDSEEFAEIARQCGAWVPFLRNQTVARDTTSSIETICSDKARLERLGETFDTICLLQPTSPLRQAKDIEGAMALHEKVRAGVVSVVKTSVRPFLLRNLDSEGHATPVVDCSKALRRQDEPIFYELNGAIYINSWKELTPDLNLGLNPFGYVMDAISSIDIDTEEDFLRAERIFNECRH